MKASEFCYWLQGYFELTDDTQPAFTPEQTQAIKRHLALVFLHDLDPKEPGDPAVSQAVHDGVKPARPPLGGVSPTGQVYRC
jgi:hypothetical protein